jgi:hypothetical protein
MPQVMEKYAQQMPITTGLNILKVMDRKEIDKRFKLGK